MNNNPNISIGVDMGGPGGIVVLEEGAMPRLLWEKELPKGLSNDSLFRILAEAVAKYGANCIVCERPFTGKWDPRPSVGMAQREKMGILKLVAERAGIPLFDFAPQTVKARCAGHGRASKERMTAHMKALFPLQSDSEHVSDAAALSICGLAELRKTAFERRAEQELKQQKKRVRGESCLKRM
jgi:crossover junction endodeoxyribonuclease RuvC